MGLVNAHNPIGLRVTVRISDRDLGTEKDLIVSLLGSRINHLRDGKAFRQKTQATIDFAQPPLAIDVIAIF
jgi:hypothetical protein